jgi:hypothetical protein
MATKRPPKPRRTPLQEASDPATDPERLDELTEEENPSIRRAAWRNPSLHEDTWRWIFSRGTPEAWANPMAPIYVFAWTPKDDGEKDVPERSARLACIYLMKEPGRSSNEGKSLINSVLVEWWGKSMNLNHMLSHLMDAAFVEGAGHPRHRQVVRAMVRLVRETIGLAREDSEALDILERWSEGEEVDLDQELSTRSNLRDVKNIFIYANNPSYPMARLAVTLDSLAKEKMSKGLPSSVAYEEVHRHMADLLRDLFPMPWVLAIE